MNAISSLFESKDTPPNISIAIPVYKAADNLTELVQRLSIALEKIQKTFEIILVEDGSQDNTWETILKINKKYPNIKAIKLSRNFGQHYAIAAALNHTIGEWIVIMDCDLQDQPEEIPKLYSKAMENYDTVFGSRKNRCDSIFKRFFSYSFYKLLSYLTGTSIDSTTGNFGIYHRRVITAVSRMHEKLRWYPIMIRWVGFRSTTIEINHAPRTVGKSSYSFRKLLYLAVDIICLSSDKPLRLSIKGGLFISFIAIAVGISLAIRALFGSVNPPLGWASLMISIWFLFGLLLFFLGILGLYISRIFNEVRARPTYIISESINLERC